MVGYSRIPELKSVDFDGALFWFAEMQVSGLMFHPDDDPADIIRADGAGSMFSAHEEEEARSVMARLFDALHDDVYAAAYPVVMNGFRVRLDA
ncbi:MAG: hypothetical protein B7Y40_01700 [Gammaproteobacteria bacterium 28-57-27]|nr:MAG: hypothetical protein B7Y40_01700 [Gammaproteobacteria bacterium 28-57-27]